MRRELRRNYLICGGKNRALAPVLRLNQQKFPDQGTWAETGSPRTAPTASTLGKTGAYQEIMAANQRLNHETARRMSLTPFSPLVGDFVDKFVGELVGDTSHCRPCRLKFVGGRHNNVIPTKREHLLLFCLHHVGG
jgi:hypothetical protein